MITLGQIVAYALGAGTTFHGGWRALFAISIVPAAFQAGLMHVVRTLPLLHLLTFNVGPASHFLPESPRYDLMNNREADARRTSKQDVYLPPKLANMFFQ